MVYLWSRDKLRDFYFSKLSISLINESGVKDPVTAKYEIPSKEAPISNTGTKNLYF